MADFYADRDNTKSPLPWPSIAPPITSIEMNDLISSLKESFSFSNGVVWVCRDDNDNQVLVFYYTANLIQDETNKVEWGMPSPQANISTKYRNHLAKIIPQYCIPSIFVRLSEIPVNHISGKYDYKSLPRPSFVSSPKKYRANALDIRGIRAAWASLLSASPQNIDISLTFSENGADSLMHVECLSLFERDHGILLKYEDLLERTGAELCQLINRDAVPLARSSQHIPDSKGVLLTGCTGFLGSRILKSALRLLPPDTSIYCLIRPKRQSADSRLISLLEGINLNRNKVFAIAGEVESKFLGLTEDDYKTLCDNTTSVIHCASLVNLSLDQKYLKNVAVTGTKNIVELCAQSHASLHFISSSAVFPHSEGPYQEDFANVNKIASGYGKTKILAEEVIKKSAVPHTIYRLPSLHDVTAPNPNDIYEHIMSSIRRNHTVPETLCFQMSDANLTAEFIVRAMYDRMAHGVINLTTNSFLTSRSFCVDDSFRVIPADEWIDISSLNTSKRNFLRRQQDILTSNATLSNDRAQVIWKEIMEIPFSKLGVYPT